MYSTQHTVSIYHKHMDSEHMHTTQSYVSRQSTHSMQNRHSTHIVHTHTVHTHAYTHIQWEAIVRAESVHTVSLYGMKLESLDGSCIPVLSPTTKTQQSLGTSSSF